MIEDVIKVFKTYDKEIKELKRGKEIIVECPFCKGKMTIKKSGYNGHLCIKCENKDFYLIE